MKQRAVWILAGCVFASAGEPLLRAKESSADYAAKVDTPPKPVRQRAPEYPLEMRYSGYRGRVVLEFVVEKDGTPRDPQVVSSNHPAFEQAAMDALLKWRFEPGKKAGEPVRSRVRQALIFDFEPGFFSVDPFTAPRRASSDLPDEFRYDVAPEVDLMVTPVYPRELALAGVKGSADVAFALDATGKPMQIEVTAASHPEFGAALAAAVNAWRFTPARKEGRPCPAILSYRHKFEAYEAADPGGSRLLAKLMKNGGADIPSLADLDRVPKTLFRAAPVYPARLRAEGVAGSVRVRFLIDRDGVPRLPVVVDAPHEELGWAAVTAVRRQRYERPLKNGKPVDAWAVLPLNFTLQEPADGTP